MSARTGAPPLKKSNCSKTGLRRPSRNRWRTRRRCSPRPSPRRSGHTREAVMRCGRPNEDKIWFEMGLLDLANGLVWRLIN